MASQECAGARAGRGRERADAAANGFLPGAGLANHWVGVGLPLRGWGRSASLGGGRGVGRGALGGTRLGYRRGECGPGGGRRRESRGPGRVSAGPGQHPN